MAFWVTYDHAGKLILANLVWSAAIGVPAFLAWAAWATGDPAIRLVIGIPTTLAAFVVALPVTTIGLAEMVKELIDTRDGSVWTMFRGIGRYWCRAIGLGVLFFVAVCSLATSAWFYAERLKDTAPWAGFAISAVAVWGLVFVALMSLLTAPAVVQKKAHIRETLRLTAALVIDNPLFVIGLAIQLVFITIICVFVPILLLIYGAAIVVVASSAYEMLARKYAARDQQAGHVASRPTAKKEIFNDEDDDYLNRGFRDFLFPWKG